MVQITVVGIGADGWDDLARASRRVVEDADVLIGGRRHLDLVPASAAVRETWAAPLVESLPALLARHTGRRVVVLASGDPLVSGVATTLVALLGPEQVVVHPAVSSVSLARARMLWPAESVDVVSLVGRPVEALHRVLTPGRRIVVLSSDGSTPAAVAAALVAAGGRDSVMTVLSDLGGATEARVSGTAGEWGSALAPALNVVCVHVATSPATVLRATVPGLPDSAFEHDGQLTKRDLRASALARLAPVPGALLWDVGAGAGSVCIEWMRVDPRCRAVAVEADADRAARIARNARALGVPDLDVRHGRAPDALDGLPAPDAVFVGGGASVAGLVERCWQALSPGGRLVVHAVTFETEAVVVAGYQEHGGELTRLSIERAAPIGAFSGWSPSRPLVQWSLQKEGSS
jgi:precorrin-6B C5,15-methyltransferase / cobalt-precorrin-6B C5,C15-methyltransferase